MKPVQMDNFKEFLGKNLDDCIGQALRYYDCPRENLEVEIVQDAKSGIFGIVGARKAKIRARRAKLAETFANLLGRQETPQASGRSFSGPKSAKSSPGCSAADNAGKRDGDDNHGRSVQARKAQLAAASPSRPTRVPASPGGRNDAPAPEIKAAPATAPVPPPSQLEEDSFEDMETPAWPARDLAELDRETLEARTLEIVGALLRPIAGRELAMAMELGQGGPRVRVDWEGDAGLLIGRDGQTLAAVQYLAARMLSRAMGSALRVQLDIGNYRARQDDRLRELARTLAEKVRQTGRPFSTRPLSSYHRRVIHLCLQDDASVQTRSIGEGPQKRVLIAPRRSCQQ